jgi:N-acetylmuramoyl-L-alanine amidase
MTIDTQKKAIQTAIGVKPDGVFGQITIGTLYKRIVGDEVAPAPPTPVAPGRIKVCVDPGHGMSNRKPGVYDGGCEHTEGQRFEEAEIVLGWGLVLEAKLKAKGVEVFMTRRDAQKPTPVSSRASAARAAGCTHFVSLHINDSEGDGPNGTETLWSRDNQKPFAAALHEALLTGLKLRDRGLQERDDLSVLRFPGPAALLELGFIENDTDREVFLNTLNRESTCSLLADAIVGAA